MNDIYSQIDLEMTQRALDLAARGIGQVSPSPLVGCVIVSGTGEIVGEGTYLFERVTHAEVIALEQAGGRAFGGTAYVSLEPHVHYGRTPPCTEALINAGIKRVVCPIEDPNPLVSGKGFMVLRENGIEVVTGVLRQKAEIQNEKFIHWHKKKRPFVHLKMAISLDGKIATRAGDSKWITGTESREKVQLLRHEYDSILVGANTIAVDDPSLTDRSGRTRNRSLLRVVLDNSLRISADSKVIMSARDFPTLVFTSAKDLKKIELFRQLGAEVFSYTGKGGDLRAVLTELAGRGIISILVEGGTATAGAFHDQKLIDKISFFVAPKIIGGTLAKTAVGGAGIEKLVDALKLRDIRCERYGEDLEITGYPILNE